MRKAIVLGGMVGTILMGVFTTNAMTTVPYGYLYTKNPLTSAPKGQAKTVGPQEPITAKCTVSKEGYTTKSVSETKNTSGSVETDWIKGSTYASEGTIFISNHTEYDVNGNYCTATQSKSY